MIAHFSLMLISGMSLTWCVMPRREVTPGFFRIQMLVVLGLSVLAALTLGKFADVDGSLLDPLLNRQWSTGLCIALAVTAFVGSVLWTLGRREAGGLFVGLIAIMSLGTLLTSFPRLGTLFERGEVLRLLSDFSSATMLGGAMTAMLLGHWYLTAPTMSIEPLKRLTYWFGCAGLLRLLVSVAGLAVAWDSIGGGTHGMWLSLRWIAGIFGPLLVAVMVWRILKYRNTQSATGVLFVGVILTFIGEMTSSLLFRSLSAPL